MNILWTRICFDLLKITESKKSHSQSEPDSNFAISFVSNFDSISKSDSEPESDFSSVLMNLDICIFFTLYLHSTK